MGPSRSLHICNDCGRQFTRKGSWQRHYRSAHLGQKDFECLFCQRKFSQKCNLTAHQNTIHGGLLIFCGEGDCDVNFSSQSALSRHIKETHEKLRMRCPIDGCYEEFRRVGLLRDHVACIHPEQDVSLDDLQYVPSAGSGSLNLHEVPKDDTAAQSEPTSHQPTHQHPSPCLLSPQLARNSTLSADGILPLPASALASSSHSRTRPRRTRAPKAAQTNPGSLITLSSPESSPVDSLSIPVGQTMEFWGSLSPGGTLVGSVTPSSTSSSLPPSIPPTPYSSLHLSLFGSSANPTGSLPCLADATPINVPTSLDAGNEFGMSNYFHAGAHQSGQVLESTLDELLASCSDSKFVGRGPYYPPAERPLQGSHQPAGGSMTGPIPGTYPILPFGFPLLRMNSRSTESLARPALWENMDALPHIRAPMGNYSLFPGWFHPTPTTTGFHRGRTIASGVNWNYGGDMYELP